MWALLPHQNQMTFSLVACTVYLFLQQSVFSFYVERSLCFEVKPQVVLRRTRCYATAGTSSSSSNIQRSPRRWNQVSSLINWAKMNGILIGDGVTIEEMPLRGLGIALSTTNSKKKGDVILEVPTKMALSVDVPRDSPSNTWISQLFETRDSSSSKNAYLESPWWVRLSLQLVALKNDICSTNNKPDMTAWIETLPQTFDTPIHWSSESIKNLQYQFMEEAVQLQRLQWRDQYNAIVQGLKIAAKDTKTATAASTTSFSSLTYEDFVWGCECARSRAFSGSYSGSPFTPAPYIFTLLLVTIYVGFNLGTLEQASNGAALVLCASIFKDFILPKFLKQKRYVICPVIDMANHASSQTNDNNSIYADVALEYLRNSYSLSITQCDQLNKISSEENQQPKQQEQKMEVYISYGARSNDQLLQYFGFVEVDNPHDVYVMPSLRQWNIDALEKACGRSFGSDRLIKLERAGLLGMSGSGTTGTGAGTMDDDEYGTTTTGISPSRATASGVIVSRAIGIDPAILQALRALVSTDEEWQNAGGAVGYFAAQVSPQNERLARVAAKTAILLELESKPTSLEQDMDMLKLLNKQQQQSNSGGTRSVVGKEMIRNAISSNSNEDRLALLFRIEKKKLLYEIITSLE